MTAPEPRALPWPTAGIAFGGDYNPEQWPREVWDEDIRLMGEAGVNFVTLGVFSWGNFEPREGEFDFGWLDEIMDRLDAAKIGVDLATPTASPPIWLHRKHPEILPVTRTGQRYAQGGRLGWCASNPTWRRYALRIVETVAARYGSHPALRMWHVSNELGGGNRKCYCDASAEHFRRWLLARYGDVQSLNDAWGTAFWGHRYADIDQVLPPRDCETAPNPGLALDFSRFSSDALLEHFLAERDVLAVRTPDLPVTTNFMVSTGPHVVDYARWAPYVDITANDHYAAGAGAVRAQDVAFAADRMRGFNPGAPWMLMEHAASAVGWRPRNRANEPGELIRDSLGHVARGADSSLFFQWRASTAGVEQFHSGMLPHAGTGTRIWREVCQLGRTLRAINEVAGSVVEAARIAILVDDEAGWAWNAGQKPHNELPLPQLAREYHQVLWQRNLLADVVAPLTNLRLYDLLIIPGLYLASDATAGAIDSFVRGGGRAIVTFLSGIVDPTNRVRAGGYPGAFRDLLGVVSEEFYPLLAGDTVALDNGWTATTWSELLSSDGAEVMARYSSGPLSGSPAVTRRKVGTGEAWYVSAWLEQNSLEQLLSAAVAGLGLQPPVQAPQDVEVVRRVGPTASYLFVLNHGVESATIKVRGVDLLAGALIDGSLTIPAGMVAVVKEL